MLLNTSNVYEKKDKTAFKVVFNFSLKNINERERNNEERSPKM